MFLFRKYLFIFLLLFLFLPIIQNRINFINVKSLSGMYKLADDTVISPAGWFSGKYQQAKEKYLRDAFGFRNLFIRSRNQLDFSLFGKAHTDDFVIGKNDDIFWGWYFKTYTGRSFAGTKVLKERMGELKFIQDELAKQNKTLLIVIAPSKDLFFPEDIPDSIEKADSTDYTVGIKLLQKEGLNYIDFNRYFIEQKNKSPYPLFYKYDSHWTDYGAFLAGDSIIATIEKIHNLKMAHTDWKDHILKETASGDELEMEDGLNLIFPFKHDLMGHPKNFAQLDTTLNGPSALFVGDSFFWSLRDQFNFWDYFKDGDFWYYSWHVYPKGIKPMYDTILMKEELKKNDVFILEVTEANISKLGFDFPGLAYPIMKSESKPSINSSEKL